MKLSEDGLERLMREAIWAWFLAFFVYCIISLWWTPMIKGWHLEEVLKTQSCYQEWALSKEHQIHYVTISYCAFEEGENNGTR